MKWLTRTGGVLFAPRATFRRIIHGREGGVAEVLLLAFLAMLGTYPLEVARVLFTAERGFGIALTSILTMYVNFSLPPLLMCVAAALMLVGAERLRGRRVPIESVMAACVYLWIPVCVLGLAGSMLRLVGADLWFLPHISLGFLIKAGAPWWVFVLWLTVSLGFSGYLALRLLAVLREDSQSEPGPVPFLAPWILGGAILLSWGSGAVYVAANLHQVLPVRAGDPAPDFSLPRADGKGQVTLSSFAGRPVVVEFWAEWCSKCVAHMPALAAWAHAHPDVSVLAIHQGGTPEEVQSYLSARQWSGITYLVDKQRQASAAYRVDTLPTFLVVGPDTHVVGVRIGAPPSGWLEAALQ